METLKTPLYDFHIDNGGRMVAFAGWDMPVQYTSGIKAEHIATRRSCGLFDVSHMAQITLEGTGAEALLEKLTPTDVGAITEGRVRYSLFLNADGGILDDLMIARINNSLQLVVNAGRATHDIAHLRGYLDTNTVMSVLENQALLALQGPASSTVLENLGLNLNGFTFMQIRQFELLGSAVTITRSGYTGEDGFEISVPAVDAVRFAEALLSDDNVVLAGLGARDTLRMEAGLPLWGHELDESTTPVEAGLRFALSKRRCDKADFPGASRIINELTNMPKRQLVGLLPEGGRPVREGTELLHNGQRVGHISSGGFSPSLNRPAALGFVATPLAAAGTMLAADNRGKQTPIAVAALPLVPHRYFRGEKT